MLTVLFFEETEQRYKQENHETIRQQINPSVASNETQVDFSDPVDKEKTTIKLSDNVESNEREQKQIIEAGNFLCEWNNCKADFHTATQVYNHVCNFHLLNAGILDYSNGQLCQWIACDQIKRQKWSLINHIKERHCNEVSLKNALSNRKRGILPVSSQTINSIINTKDAALLAIQRNQKKNKDEFLVSNLCNYVRWVKYKVKQGHFILIYFNFKDKY